MALATYAQLKASVADWLHRTDLTTPIIDGIALCEARIRNDLRCRAMEQSATGTLSATTLALPTRFAEARRVMLNDVPQRYLTPEEWQYLRTGSNARYTILGTNFVFQSSTATYQVDYWQWFAPFSADADTNWLLTNHPGVYLFGTLAEMAAYTWGEPGGWDQRYQAEVAKIRLAESKMTGPLIVRPETAE